MEQWQADRTWNDMDDFSDWLQQHNMKNSDAIIAKLTLEGPIALAGGAKRLRYEHNNFYLEHSVESEPDFGAGKQIDTEAIRKLLTKEASNFKMTVKLDRKMDIGLSIRESDNEQGDFRYDVRLNPTRLRGPKQVKEAVRRCLAGLTIK